ncbi:MAG: glycosyltransferase family 4 protein [Chitinophagaceae bacterium]|nr:glycosyltransferase family 4 protein [Chitinophagaceae bacterium]
MKRVVDIMPYSYLPYYSGGQKSIAQFLQYLGRITSLDVITVEENDKTLAREYNLVPFLKKGKSKYYDFRLTSVISDHLSAIKATSIIWEHPYYAWLAFRVRRRTGIKTIIHTHNIEHQRFRSLGKWWWPLLKYYERWCFRKADLIFFIAPEERSFAIDQWKIAPEKCINVPFGVPNEASPADKLPCKQKICNELQIAEDTTLLLFNGLLSYQPNLDAVEYILKNINPLLNRQMSNYKILICGKELPATMNDLREYKNVNIIYAGFVPDIESYFKAADIFINPVVRGGGVKTKLIEAIANGTSSVSTKSGAAGVEKQSCGNKLTVVSDNDWEGFVRAIVSCSSMNQPTPQLFYDTYHWGNIAKRVEQYL